MADRDPDRGSDPRDVRAVLAVLVLLVSLTVVDGWWFGWDAVTRMLPGSVEVAPNTALALIAMAVALLRPTARVVGLVGAAVGALGAATLTGYVADRPDGVVVLLPWAHANGHPTRMAEATAVAFVLLGLAMIARARGITWVVQVVTPVAFAIGFFGLLAYAYNASELYDVMGYTRLAAPTAICLGLVSFGLLLLDPDRGLVGLLRDRGSAGRVLRRMIPFFLVVFPATGGFVLWGHERGWFDHQFGFATLVVVMASCGVAVVWRAGLRIAAADQGRDEARAALEELNADLAHQVQVRSNQANRALNRFRAVMESAPDAMLGVGPEGVIVLVNAEAEKLFGYERSELLGQPVEVLMPAALAGRHVAHREAYLARPERRAMGAGQELAARRKDGSEFPAEVSLSTIDSDDGPLVMAAVRDATERREFEAALAAARDAAERSARTRQEFLATMSHEIRTPMNAVIGMTSLLLDSSLDPQQRDYLETIRTSGDHLLALINDVLDYAKIDAGRLELESVPFDVREWLHSTVELIASSAHDKGLELAYDIDPQVPARLLGDPARLRQILVNLLSNAVKFTDHGEVEVEVGVDGVQPEGLWLRMSVRDTGIGIEASHLENLFDPFTQADSSITRVYGGTGLGLAIARRLARAMGGDLMLTSNPGDGTTATVRWRAQPGSPAVPVPAAHAQEDVLAGVRLLVVDDNRPSRRILHAWAERHGMLCDAVEGAEQALSLIESGAQFPVAILDLMMPGIDGIELSRLLRARDPGIQQVLLSSAGPYTADLVHGEQFDAVLTKPVRPDRLFGRIAALLAGSEEPAGAEGSEQRDAGGPPPMRILVVEDVLVNQKVARHLLARFGYDCDVASGGEEALAALERKDYQLVLMDVQMPGVDGLEATRRIRARWPERSLRIVALTANVGAEDVRACHDAGMDGFLGKPITLESLGAVLDQAARDSAGGNFTATLAPADTDAVVDVAAGPRIADMVEPEVLEELFGLFAEGLDASLAEIEEGCLHEDRDAVSRAAHRLLGSARSLGIERLGILCQRVENYAGEGDWPRTKSLIPRMRSWQDLVRQRGPDLLR
jgi:PAS domain S-box-containing protein